MCWLQVVCGPCPKQSAEVAESTPTASSHFWGHAFRCALQMIPEELASVLLFVSVGGPFVCFVFAVLFDLRMFRSEEHQEHLRAKKAQEEEQDAEQKDDAVDALIAFRDEQRSQEDEQEQEQEQGFGVPETKKTDTTG